MVGTRRRRPGGTDARKAFASGPLLGMWLLVGSAACTGVVEQTTPDAMAPVALAGIRTVDAAGAAVLSPYAELPMLGPIRLDGTASYDPLEPARGYAHLEFDWRILSTPMSSLSELEFTGSDGVGGAATPLFLPDVAGPYRFRLTVTNPDVDLVSEPVEVELFALALLDLEVGLSWATPGTDLDLHLLGPDGDYWTDGDCFFGNPNPNWGSLGDDSDDPTLVADDDYGGTRLHPGNERIELQQPPWGRYRVVVVYHSDHHTDHSVTPWIDVSVAGEELSGPIEAPGALVEGEAWIAAEIDWPDMDVRALDELTTHDELGGPPTND
jgi:hypothetical protein